MEQQKREVKPSVEPLSPPKKFDPQPYAGARPGRAVQHAKAGRRAQAGSAAAEFPAGGRDQPAQGAARGLSGRQHGDGRQRRPRRPPVCAAEGRQPALPGQAGRLPRPELRKDHQDLRDRCGATARSCRTRRANGSSATAPSSFRRRRDEQACGRNRWLRGARVFVHSLVLAGAALPALVAERDPVDHQLAAGGRRGGPDRAERAAGRGAGRLHGPGAAAHRDRPAGRHQRARQVDASRSTRATCARSAWPSRASAPASS